ncbi:MAG: DUF3365 domain-containing protein [Saprospiraceae bacterium]
MKVFFGLILIVILGCKNAKVEVTTDSSEMAAAFDPIKAKSLMETQCYLCHSPTAPEKEGRIGPPLVAIKAYYIDEKTTKAEFTEALWNFLEKPTEEKAKLKDAVKRFGLMPYQSYKKEDIAQIAEYLYTYQIEEPEWFKTHWSKNHPNTSYINSGEITSDSTANTIEDIGLMYALDTKNVLGKHLMGTIQAKGTVEALAFCNEKAYPLTDSMSMQYHATIKRVSDKPRNPNNLANKNELEKIAFFKSALSSGDEIKPIVERVEDTNIFYYPITTNSMCLQCHGKPNDHITSDVMATIQKLYPKDLAVGYDVNQVRGIWSITFKDKAN